MGIKGQGQGWAKIKFTYLAVTSHLIVTETSNSVHILDCKKPYQIWPWPWPLTLTLKSSPKLKIVETYQLIKTSQNMLRCYVQVIIYRGHQRSRSRSSKGQIHLLGYNFTFSLIVTETSNSVHNLDCEKPCQIWPWPWPLTFTLKISPKVKNF